MADKFSLIRSLHHEMSAHNDGSIEVLTGKTPSVPDPTSQARSDHPDFGMIASRLRGLRPDGLPQYIGVQQAPFMTKPGYLGASHKAFETGDPSGAGFAPRNLTLVTGIDNRRLDDRKSLVSQFDRFRVAFEREVEGIDEFRAAAFNILTSATVGQAFDLSQEDPKLRDQYGRHRWGQSCLLRARLAEAGTAVINVDATAPNDTTKHFSWDDHAGAFHLDYAQRERLPQMDQALSPLSRPARPRLDRTGAGDRLRRIWTDAARHARPDELFRPDRPGPRPLAGGLRALIAGGGLRMGQVVGATNSKSEYPVEDPRENCGDRPKTSCQYAVYRYLP